MTEKGKFLNKGLSESEIDKTVVEQADNDSAWEKPVHVQKSEPASLALPAELVARAAFLARLHREMGVEQWLMRIIKERIELEEVAFGEAKRDLAAKDDVGI